MTRMLLLVLACLSACPALAHKFDSGFLSLAEQQGNRYAARLKAPMRGGRPLAVLQARLPAGCERIGPVQTRRTVQAWHESWHVQCEAALDGRRIFVEGLNPAVPNVVIALKFRDGAERILLLDDGEAGFVFAHGTQRTSAESADYLPLGITHILAGPDHLLFVAGLLLVVQAARARIGTLVGTVTAFTVAHSITLAASVLGHVSLPATPVEAVIALSILLLAVELSAVRGLPHPPTGLTFRRPWLIAFGFGLIHGFGFAGALREVGLPEHAVGWALLLFNVGVEIGQLLFVAVLLAAGWALMRIRPALLPLGQNALVLLMGTASGFWVIERVLPA